MPYNVNFGHVPATIPPIKCVNLCKNHANSQAVDPSSLIYSVVHRFKANVPSARNFTIQLFFLFSAPYNFQHENDSWLILEWNPQGRGRRSRGRPKQSWRRTVSKELENIGRTWGEAKLLANNKIRWKAMVEALCLSRG